MLKQGRLGCALEFDGLDGLAVKFDSTALIGPDAIPDGGHRRDRDGRHLEGGRPDRGHDARAVARDDLVESRREREAEPAVEEAGFVTRCLRAKAMQVEAFQQGE